jgi:hypothetical protein
MRYKKITKMSFNISLTKNKLKLINLNKIK